MDALMPAWQAGVCPLPGMSAMLAAALAATFDTAQHAGFVIGRC